MKRSILLTTIFGLSFISNQSLYANGLKNNLINASLIIGGVGFFINLISKKNSCEHAHVESDIDFYENKLSNNPADNKTKTSLTKAKKNIEWASRKKFAYRISGLLLTTVGLYRACTQKN